MASRWRNPSYVASRTTQQPSGSYQTAEGQTVYVYQTPTGSVSGTAEELRSPTTTSGAALQGLPSPVETTQPTTQPQQEAPITVDKTKSYAEQVNEYIAKQAGTYGKVSVPTSVLVRALNQPRKRFYTSEGERAELTQQQRAAVALQPYFEKGTGHYGTSAQIKQYYASLDLEAPKKIKTVSEMTPTEQQRERVFYTPEGTRYNLETGQVEMIQKPQIKQFQETQTSPINKFGDFKITRTPSKEETPIITPFYWETTPKTALSQATTFKGQTKTGELLWSFDEKGQAFTTTQLRKAQYAGTEYFGGTRYMIPAEQTYLEKKQEEFTTAAEKYESKGSHAKAFAATLVADLGVGTLYAARHPIKTAEGLLTFPITAGVKAVEIVTSPKQTFKSIVSQPAISAAKATSFITQTYLLGKGTKLITKAATPYVETAKVKFETFVKEKTPYSWLSEESKLARQGKIIENIAQSEAPSTPKQKQIDLSPSIYETKADILSAERIAELEANIKGLSKEIVTSAAKGRGRVVIAEKLVEKKPTGKVIKEDLTRISVVDINLKQKGLQVDLAKIPIAEVKGKVIKQITPTDNGYSILKGDLGGVKIQASGISLINEGKLTSYLKTKEFASPTKKLSFGLGREGKYMSEVEITAFENQLGKFKIKGFQAGKVTEARPYSSKKPIWETKTTPAKAIFLGEKLYTVAEPYPKGFKRALGTYWEDSGKIEYKLNEGVLFENEKFLMKRVLPHETGHKISLEKPLTKAEKKLAGIKRLPSKEVKEHKRYMKEIDIATKRRYYKYQLPKELMAEAYSSYLQRLPKQEAKNVLGKNLEKTLAWKGLGTRIKILPVEKFTSKKIGEEFSFVKPVSMKKIKTSKEYGRGGYLMGGIKGTAQEIFETAKGRAIKYDIVQATKYQKKPFGKIKIEKLHPKPIQTLEQRQITRQINKELQLKIAKQIQTEQIKTAIGRATLDIPFKKTTQIPKTKQVPKAITYPKLISITRIRSQPKLTSFPKQVTIQKTFQEPRLVQQPRLSQLQKTFQEPRLSQLQKTTMITPPRTPIIPRITTPTIPKTPPLVPIGWTPRLPDLSTPKGYKQKTRGKKSLFYIPDFTSKALGLEPTKISKKQARKLLRQTFTGLELRKEVIISD